MKAKNKKNKENHNKGHKGGRDGVGHGGVKHMPSKSTIDMSSHGNCKVRNS
jgi:hypothetical protein